MINPLSQSVGLAAAGLLSETVSALGLRLELASPPPKGLENAIRQAIDSEPDVVVVMAGDGTARAAARLCGPDGPPLIVLPGGTMNVLSHALYGVTPWRETLQAVLESGAERTVSGGVVGGRPYWALRRSGRLCARRFAPSLWPGPGAAGAPLYRAPSPAICASSRITSRFAAPLGSA